MAIREKDAEVAIAKTKLLDLEIPDLPRMTLATVAVHDLWVVLRNCDDPRRAMLSAGLLARHGNMYG